MEEYLYRRIRDDGFASQVQVEDNGDNRTEHRMIQRVDLVISMDLLQAMKRCIRNSIKIRYIIGKIL